MIRSAHTIIDLLDRAAAATPGSVAVRDRCVDATIEWTYAEYATQVYRMARFLRERGVRAGESVAILMVNSRWWGVTTLAIHALDAVAVPIDVHLGTDETTAILDAAGATVLVTADSMREKAAAAAAASASRPGLVEIIGIHDAHSPFAATLAAFDAQPLPRRGMGTATAFIIFTSGTTGKPKGVVLTHLNILTDVTHLLAVLGISTHERFVSILPLNHVYEITGGFTAPLALGGSITYAGSLRPDVIRHCMQDVRMTVMMVVPSFVRVFIDRIKTEGTRRWGRLFMLLLNASMALQGYGIPIGRLLFSRVRHELSPCLKCFICGGAPTPAHLVREFAALGITVLQGYGLTETSPVIAVNTLRRNRIGSVGIPLPCVETRIVPDGGEGNEGELWVRGPIVFREYHRDPAMTRSVFHRGWFRTGDIVRRDRAGYLHVCGRMKNLIVTEGGKKVVPEDIEDLLHRSPYVREICVLGMPCRNGGEEPVAVVVPAREKLEADHGTDKARQDDAVRQDIRRLAATLADYKRPREVILREDMPRTATLKIKRTELRNLMLGKR